MESKKFHLITFIFCMTIFLNSFYCSILLLSNLRLYINIYYLNKACLSEHYSTKSTSPSSYMLISWGEKAEAALQNDCHMQKAQIFTFLFSSRKISSTYKTWVLPNTTQPPSWCFPRGVYLLNSKKWPPNLKIHSHENFGRGVSGENVIERYIANFIHK